MDGRPSPRPSGSMEIRRDDYHFYRRGSNLSEASFIADVDMAQDEMFSGPTSESVPTSSIGFTSRRQRSDSVTSFTYFDEGQEGDSDSWLDEEAVTVEESEQEEIGEHQNDLARLDEDLETGEYALKRRQSSRLSRRSRLSQSSRGSRISVDDPLLRRHDSTNSGASNLSGRGGRDRISQKIYIQSEDLTIVIAGFRSSMAGYLVYFAICAVTLGLAYLLFRWLPRWRLRLVGATCSLKDCKWVVIEVSRSKVCAGVDLHFAKARCRINGENWQCNMSSHTTTVTLSHLFLGQRKSVCIWSMMKMTIRWLMSFE